MTLVLFGEQRKHILSNPCAAKRYLRRQGFSAVWEAQLHCFWPELLQTISEILVCVQEQQNLAVPVLFCLLFHYVPALGVISLWKCHCVCPDCVSQDADPATVEPHLCSWAGCFSLRVQSRVLSFGMCRFHLRFSLKSTQLQVLAFEFQRNVKNWKEQEAMGSEPALQSLCRSQPVTSPTLCFF